MRVAAIGDLHCRLDGRGQVTRLLKGVDAEADVLVVAGDLTNLGLIEEMELLVEELGRFALPKVAVVGNHDHENGQIELLVPMLRDAGVHVLDAEVWETGGVAFVGTMGCCGGFGEHRLQPFGEAVLKRFVQASVDEVVRLERALARAGADRKVAVLHYAPVAGTLRGEHPEIYPWLGFSPLGDAIDRQGADLVVHGHAHNGAAEGRTPGGIPVRNVCHQVLRRSGRPYALFDV
jgi:hypothetical protein